MSEVTIYHNPRCSKSRQTLELLKEHGVEANIVLYLDNPPDSQTLKTLLGKLGLTPRELMRSKEAEVKELGLNAAGTTDSELIDAMVSHPKIIERPIVVRDDRAVLGRPPENVLALL